MNTPLLSQSCSSTSSKIKRDRCGRGKKYPSALDIATHAIVLLENNHLFNSGHGAVFTRDGINELEASVMVSRGYKKRGVGVMGLRRVKNPILLAKKMLEHGDKDVEGKSWGGHSGALRTHLEEDLQGGGGAGEEEEADLDVPTAQGHTLIFGQAAEQLARDYGLELVEPEYFFTQRRWNDHVRALERERNSGGRSTATWSAHEYLPQGTVGAVALDRDGVVCCATSTGGMTNKLTGRIGDTPVVGAGFWAGRFTKPGVPAWLMRGTLSSGWDTSGLVTTVDMGLSGTGNGDSFLRISAGRQVGSIARYRPDSTLNAVREVTGPGGELERSAGKRWGKTGEGEGGMIAIESEVVQDAEGNEVARGYKIIQEFNCGGMFRAWVDHEGRQHFRVWREER